MKFPQSVMIWAAMSSAGVGPLCFLKSTVNAAIYQEILEHFMLPSADKLYGDADFIFQQDLAPAHTAKGTKSFFNDHGVTSVSHRILWDLWRQVTSHINLHIHDVIASSLHSDEFWHLRSVLNVIYCNTTMPNKAVHIIFSVVIHKTSINGKQEPLI